MPGGVDDLSRYLACFRLSHARAIFWVYQFTNYSTLRPTACPAGICSTAVTLPRNVASNLWLVWTATNRCGLRALGHRTDRRRKVSSATRHCPSRLRFLLFFLLLRQPATAPLSAFGRHSAALSLVCRIESARSRRALPCLLAAPCETCLSGRGSRGTTR